MANPSEETIAFRTNLKELIVLAGALCSEGQTVEDLVGVMQLALSNDLQLTYLMERTKAFVARPK
jgi:hypothetical protein